MIRAISFDAGGTLIRVRGSVGAVYASVAAAHGVTVAAGEIEGRFRAAFPKMPPLCFPGRSAGEIAGLERGWWRQLVREVFAEVEFADFDAYFEELFEYFADAHAWELFPDARTTLESLRERDLALAVVSNFDGRLLRICEGMGLTPFFDHVVMSARVGYAKPHPGIFRVAVDALGVAPAETLHVGDSTLDDLQGSQSAGLRALRIVRRGRPQGALEINDLRRIIDHL